jgi:hypothetical protein
MAHERGDVFGSRGLAEGSDLPGPKSRADAPAHGAELRDRRPPAAAGPSGLVRRLARFSLEAL